VPTVEQFRAIVQSIREQEFADTRNETADYCVGFVPSCALMCLQEHRRSLQSKHRSGLIGG
jgi:hypothetical protein